MFLVSLLNSMPGAIAQGMIWGIAAIGIYITYKVLNLSDLTVDGSICTGASMMVILLLNGINVYVALVCSIITGAIAGLITGVLHIKFGIPAILAGILTQLALYSINLHIMGFGSENFAKSNLPISVDKYQLMLSSRYVRELSLRNPLLILTIILVILIAVLYWFFGTEIGCSIRATGANVNMAKAQGINTDNNVIFGLMISNAIIALAGALLAQYQGFSDINMGRGAIVVGLAAIIIGDVLFSKVFTNFGLKLMACVFGSIIYYVVIQIILKMGLSTDDLKLLSAIVVSLFLAIPYWKSKRGER